MAVLAETRTPVFDELQDNRRWLKEHLGVGTSIDVLSRDLTVAGVDCNLVVVDGYQNAQVLTLMLSFMLSTRRDQVTPDELSEFLRERIPFVEVSRTEYLEDAVTQILTGPSVLFVDGCGYALVIDTREYPARKPSEPETQKLINGPKDGFDETILDNMTLIRRRIRDPNLRVEAVKVGRRSRMDVALLYIKDIAKPELVRLVRRRLKEITTDAIPMGEKAIAEYLNTGPRQWWNLFPTVRYTERPDICATHLMGGRIVLLVDTTPVAIILPASFFDQMEDALEYHLDTATGTFLRIVRYFGLFLGWFFAPLYVWLVAHPHLIPRWLSFVGPSKPDPIPLFLQFVIADIAVEMILISLLNMPQSMTTTLGVLGAVIIGQVATKVKLLSPEAILYVVVATLGELVVPTADLNFAIHIFRVLLYFLAAVPWWPLLPFGIGFNLLLLFSTTSFGEAYAWPLIPLDVVALWQVVVRRPLPARDRRPGFVAPVDPDRS